VGFPFGNPATDEVETMTPADTAAALRRAIETALPGLRALSDERASKRPAPGKWSPKELIGHLLDSATNNHNRFVRGILDPEVRLPKYEQEGWVRVQGYATAHWDTLLLLWCLYNYHLAGVIESIPPPAVGTPCFIGDNPPMPLGELAADYVRHLEHHLGQVLNRGEAQA
jgi:hypothetical protein